MQHLTLINLRFFVPAIENILIVIESRVNKVVMNLHAYESDGDEV